MFLRCGLRGLAGCSALFGCTLFLAALSGALPAQTTDEVARALASQAAEWFPARASVSVECVNRSQVKDAEFAPVCRAFSRELRNQGLVPGAAPAVLTLTASESPSGRLLIARTAPVTGAGRVAMLPWNLSSPLPEIARRVRLERTLLMESAAPVLDYEPLQDGASLAVLEPLAVNLYSRTAAGWELVRRLLLPLPKAAPRDPRGRLVATGPSAMTVYLPGYVCTSEDAMSQPFTCAVGESGWNAGPGVPVRWVAGRNFLQSDHGRAYAIAPVALDRMLIASLDGSIRLQGPQGENAVASAGFGSDVAAVEAPCGTFAVVTRSGDAVDTDQLTPVDVRSGRLEPAGASLTVPGPVTALWPSSSRAEIHAVIRNAGTGAYEISRMAINCVQ